MDQRVSYVLGAALVSLLLLPLAPSEFRIVCEITSAVYVLLALATALDRWSRRRELGDHQRAVHQHTDESSTP